MISFKGYTLVEQVGGDWAGVYDSIGNLVKDGHVSDVYTWIVENLDMNDRYSDVLYDEKVDRGLRTAFNLTTLDEREKAHESRLRRIEELEAELKALKEA